MRETFGAISVLAGLCEPMDGECLLSGSAKQENVDV